MDLSKSITYNAFVKEFCGMNKGDFLEPQKRVVNAYQAGKSYKTMHSQTEIQINKQNTVSFSASLKIFNQQILSYWLIEMLMSHRQESTKQNYCAKQG